MTIPVVVLSFLLSAATAARSPWSPQTDTPQYKLIPIPRGKKLGTEDRANLKRAMENLEAGKYDTALVLLDSVLDTSPHCTSALRARARTLLTLGYLKWKHLLVTQALEDTKKFLWQDYRDMAMRDMLALLKQLHDRMERIDSMKRARKKRRKAGKQSPRTR